MKITKAIRQQLQAKYGKNGYRIVEKGYEQILLKKVCNPYTGKNQFVFESYEVNRVLEKAV